MVKHHHLRGKKPIPDEHPKPEPLQGQDKAVAISLPIVAVLGVLAIIIGILFGLGILGGSYIVYPTSYPATVGPCGGVGAFITSYGENGIADASPTIYTAIDASYVDPETLEVYYSGTEHVGTRNYIVIIKQSDTGTVLYNQILPLVTVADGGLTIKGVVAVWGKSYTFGTAYNATFQSIGAFIICTSSILPVPTVLWEQLYTPYAPVSTQQATDVTYTIANIALNPTIGNMFVVGNNGMNPSYISYSCIRMATGLYDPGFHINPTGVVTYLPSNVDPLRDQISFGGVVLNADTTTTIAATITHRNDDFTYDYRIYLASFDKSGNLLLENIIAVSDNRPATPPPPPHTPFPGPTTAAFATTTPAGGVSGLTVNGLVVDPVTTNIVLYGGFQAIGYSISGMLFRFNHTTLLGDTGFGENGFVFLPGPPNPNSNSFPFSTAAVYRDSSVLASLWNATGDLSKIGSLFAKYLPNGTPDMTFNNGSNSFDALPSNTIYCLVQSSVLITSPLNASFAQLRTAGLYLPTTGFVNPSPASFALCVYN